MQIEFIKEINIPECAELLIKTFNREPWNDQWTLETALKYLKEFFSFPRFVGFMIVEDGKAVGVAFCHEKTWWTKDELYVDEFYISPEVQRKGYGKALLREVAHVAVTRGCGRLEWSCLDWNQPSIDFYKSLGAESMDEWTVYRAGGDVLRKLAGIKD